MNNEKENYTTCYQPGYIELYRSGELARRADVLTARLASCDLCPRCCGANRLEDEYGFCRSGHLAAVASVCAHQGEEPAISGRHGSGTIFFSNCTMKCSYCQNYQISQDPCEGREKEISSAELAGHMLHLQNDLLCHNINLVSPSHFVPQIVQALLSAIPAGLRIPLVYNTSSYDSPLTLKELDGIIDIYLADLKYASEKQALELSSAADYVSHARSAIKEMYRQTGNLLLGEDGTACRGLIVRHLVLPNRLAGSAESLSWLAQEVSPQVTVSLMSQYAPVHRASTNKLLARRITVQEYNEVLDIAAGLGLENGWTQEMSAPECYLPDFQKDSNPFSS